MARYFSQILAFADLRNAITHSGYRNGQPIAAPFPETVAAAMELRSELLQPTRVDRYLHAPITAQVTEPLDRHLRTMVASGFSQLPAFHEGTYRGLLTTNAIARWVGAHLEDDIMELDVPVGEVLGHAEPDESAQFVPRALSAVEACDILTAPGAPVALLVTQTGQRGESLLGVLTVFDVPQMLRDVSVSMP